MKKILALSLALCLLLTGCGTRLDKSTRLRKFKDDATADALYQTAQTAADSMDGAKLSIGIVRDGRVRFFSFGGASEDTLYELGTLTQLFTCITALDYLDMDIPVSTYLDAYPDNTLTLPDNSITASMLATHTAGFANWPDDLPDNGNPCFGYTDRRLFNYVARAKLLYEPGTHASESAIGIGLLGNIMEAKQKGWAKVTGMISSSVFQRVGMYSTLIDVPESKASLRALGHDENGDVAEFRSYDALAAAAAFYSSAYDMTLFAAACMDQISTYDGKTPSFPDQAKKAFSIQYDGEGGARGYGCLAQQTDAGTVFWQSSTLGGFGGYFALCPEAGTGVIVLCDHSISMEELGLNLITVLSEGE